jgi:hypothetical protein
MPKKESVDVDQQEMGDIDDYDHRSLHTQPPPSNSSSGKKLVDIDDFDQRSKWALGNVTTQDIQQEEDARQKKKAEKEAKKKQDDDVRHHAWYG